MKIKIHIEIHEKSLLILSKALVGLIMVLKQVSDFQVLPL